MCELTTEMQEKFMDRIADILNSLIIDHDMDAIIHLDGALRRFYTGTSPIHLSAGLNLHQAKIAAGIPTSMPVAALVNGAVSDLNYCLQPGDVVHLIPQIAGG